MVTAINFDPEAAFLEAFDSQLAEAPEGTEWQAAGRASTAWPNGEDEAWWRANGPAMVQRWVEWREATPWTTWVSPDGSLGIELELTVSMAGVPVKLFIDNVMATLPNNQRPVVVDKKSGSRKPKGLLQLGIYKVAIEQTWPAIKVAGGCYWMARTGEPTGVENLDLYTPELIGAYMRRLKMARSAGIFLPNVGDFCRGCKVGRYCAINGGSESHLDPDYALMGHT